MQRDYPKRPIVGIGVVIWRDGRVLLIQRGQPPRAGSWSLPGGVQELGETVSEAARREVREETGLELGELQLVDVVDSIERDAAGRVRRHYTLVDFTAAVAGGSERAGSDAAALAWFDPEELEELGLWPPTLAVIRAARRLIDG
jgi:ADP-ribose pyrophosphatase YjhB (NUDIX family)